MHSCCPIYLPIFETTRPWPNEHGLWGNAFTKQHIITVCQQSCGKVMFSEEFVRLQGGGCSHVNSCYIQHHPKDSTMPLDSNPMLDSTTPLKSTHSLDSTPPLPTAPCGQQARFTHPTGMLSCFKSVSSYFDSRKGSNTMYNSCNRQLISLKMCISFSFSEMNIDNREL